MLRSVAVLFTAVPLVLTGSAVAAEAAQAPAAPPALLAGELGIEGGAFPGTFHPTAGTVSIAFEGTMPLVLVKQVGPSGRFRVSLAAGSYVVTGCGPATATTAGRCSTPKKITLTPGQVRHIKLVWEMVP